MAHVVKVWWGIKSSFLGVKLGKYEFLPENNVIHVSIYGWTVKSSSATFTVTSHAQCVEIISHLRIKLRVMSLWPSVVIKPMDVENGASVLWIVFSARSWVSVICKLNKNFKGIWDFDINWIFFWPLIVSVDNDVFISFRNFFC